MGMLRRNARAAEFGYGEAIQLLEAITRTLST